MNDGLQVNIINEKIYFFLWFWFVALAIITGAQQVGILFHRLKSGAKAIDIDTVLRHRHRHRHCFMT